MITSSNFFRKSFFTIEQPPAISTFPKHQKVGPWDDKVFPNFVSISSQPIHHRHHSSINHYNNIQSMTTSLQPQSQIYSRNMTNKGKYNKRDKIQLSKYEVQAVQSPIQISKQVLKIYQTSSNQKNNTNRQFKNIDRLLNTKYRIKELERILCKVNKRQKSVYEKDNQLNFIKKKKLNIITNQDHSFNIYQKCVKQVKRYRYLQPLHYSLNKKNSIQ